jgi:hypothetical protein
MSVRRTTTGMPIWVRVSAITTLVLVGVVVISMLLGGSGIADHGGGRQVRGMDHDAAGQPGQAGTGQCEDASQAPAKEGGPSDRPVGHAPPGGVRVH